MSPSDERRAKKYFFHTLNRFLDKQRSGEELHPYDWHKVEGAAAQWTEAIRTVREETQ